MVPQKTPQKTEPEKPKPQYFTVKVEALAPIVTTYKILAESPEQALQLLATQSPQSKETHWTKQRNKKVTVYQLQTHMILLGPKEVK